MEYVETRREKIETRLQEVIRNVDQSELTAEMEHITLSGGKRVRPTLTLLVCEAANGDTANALDFAAGIELVHNASLVVDDIIDRSDIRRGRKSAWEQFEHSHALIASDGLIGEAFELFSSDPRAMETVAEAMVDLGEGEATELVDKPTSEQAYMELARQKTGSLFRAAAELGAIAANADTKTINDAGEYAERVGIAFQLRDDVLDAIGESEDIGKPTGQDAAMNRPSILQVTDKSTEDVNTLAYHQAEAAQRALDGLDWTDSQARSYLEDLAEYVVTRER
ncbi:MAG: polyprenyl synthetase family protein [Halobacteriaceae archaeon]